MKSQEIKLSLLFLNNNNKNLTTSHIWSGTENSIFSNIRDYKALNYKYNVLPLRHLDILAKLPKECINLNKEYPFYDKNIWKVTTLSLLLLCKTTHTANIYSGNWDTHKKCTSYKYLPYTLQYRSVDITVNHCKSVFTFFHCTWSSN